MIISIPTGRTPVQFPPTVNFLFIVRSLWRSIQTDCVEQETNSIFEIYTNGKWSNQSKSRSGTSFTFLWYFYETWSDKFYDICNDICVSVVVGYYIIEAMRLNSKYNRNLCRNVVRNNRGRFVFCISMFAPSPLPRRDLWFQQVSTFHILYFLSFISLGETLSLGINTRTGWSASWLWTLYRRLTMHFMFY